MGKPIFGGAGGNTKAHGADIPLSLTDLLGFARRLRSMPVMVAMMHEQVHQGAAEEQRIGQEAEYVPPMLAPKIEQRTRAERDYDHDPKASSMTACLNLSKHRSTASMLAKFDAERSNLLPQCVDVATHSLRICHHPAGLPAAHHCAAALHHTATLHHRPALPGHHRHRAARHALAGHHRALAGHPLKLAGAAGASGLAVAAMVVAGAGAG